LVREKKTELLSFSLIIFSPLQNSLGEVDCRWKELPKHIGVLLVKTLEHEFKEEKALKHDVILPLLKGLTLLRFPWSVYPTIAEKLFSAFVFTLENKPEKFTIQELSQILYYFGETGVDVSSKKALILQTLESRFSSFDDFQIIRVFQGYGQIIIFCSLFILLSLCVLICFSIGKLNLRWWDFPTYTKEQVKHQLLQLGTAFPLIEFLNASRTVEFNWQAKGGVAKLKEIVFLSIRRNFLLSKPQTDSGKFVAELLHELGEAGKHYHGLPPSVQNAICVGISESAEYFSAENLKMVVDRYHFLILLLCS
jgi:hypothetical protein